MPDLTLNQRFGSNVTYNNTNKTLTINLSDLTDSGDIVNSLGLDISGLTAANIEQYASKILYALLLLSFQKQPQTNNDETVSIYITNGGRRELTRNGVSQFSYLLTVNNYTPNNLAPVLDPDLMA
jgi:hypothetical protein